jgi:hypothetical protein
MAAFEAHLDRHDYVLGGRPSLADFGLMGPLYGHIFRDPVSGVDVRTRYPLVADWVERTNNSNAVNARTYNQSLWHLDGTGAMREIGPANTDGGQWLGGDAVPPTMLALLRIFFEEMWPVLSSACAVVSQYVRARTGGGRVELPSKSYGASGGGALSNTVGGSNFVALQTGVGALTTEFVLGGVTARRMVTGYQVWRLQRLNAVLKACVATAPGQHAVESLLKTVGGLPLLQLEDALRGCGTLVREGGRIYSVECG